MKLNIKNRLKKLYRGSWFITLFATTLGVLLAFYLNNVSYRLKIESRKQVAIENLNNEISNNTSTLTDSDDNLRLIGFLREVRKIDNEISNDLVVSIDEMRELKTKYSDFIEIRDSISNGTDQVKYNVAYTFELNLDDLQKISWETSKMSDVINELNYDCLQVLVRIYSLQEIYLNEQQKILEYFVNAEHQKLLSAMGILQQLKTQLLGVMVEGQNKIDDCN